MRELAATGMTMLVVTHEMGFAREVADQLVFMDGGVVVESGNPREVLANPQHERTKGFLSKAALGLVCDRHEYVGVRDGRAAEHPATSVGCPYYACCVVHLSRRSVTGNRVVRRPDRVTHRNLVHLPGSRCRPRDDGQLHSLQTCATTCGRPPPTRPR